jgi:GTP-binding protein
VPVGTLIWNSDTGEQIADLNEVGKEVTVAQGGRGGLGNMNFKTSTRQAPRFAQPGTDGQELNVRLELRLIADVGIIGFPNVGKSTLISRISAAKPKIADYPFTTLVPNLGVVRVGEGHSFVVADIPGLIPGASEGAGLGFQFLRHVARVRLFVHVLAFDWTEGRDPIADYEVIRKELAAFQSDLMDKEEIIVLNKADVTESGPLFEKLEAYAKKRKIEVHLISAVTGKGIKELVYLIASKLTALGAPKMQKAEKDLESVRPETIAAPAPVKAEAEAETAEEETRPTPAPKTTAVKKTAKPAKKAAKPAKKAAKPAKKAAKPTKKAAKPTKKAAKPAKKAAKPTKKAAKPAKKAAKPTKKAAKPAKKAAAPKKKSIRRR